MSMHIIITPPDSATSAAASATENPEQDTTRLTVPPSRFSTTETPKVLEVVKKNLEVVVNVPETRETKSNPILYVDYEIDEDDRAYDLYMCDPSPVGFMSEAGTQRYYTRSGLEKEALKAAEFLETLLKKKQEQG